MLQLDSWPDGGRILINGHEVADEPSSTADRVVRYLRPFAFALPPGLLQAQDNRLQIDWGSRETLVLVPRLLIGERELLLPMYERKLFWEHTVVQGSMVFAAVVTLVMLGIWGQQRRREAPVEYLLIGLSALGWIIFNAVLLWSPVAASWFLWRRMIGFVGIGLFVLAMWVCLARLAGWRSRAFDVLCAAWLVLGPLIMLGGFALTGATHLPGAEMLWSLGAAGLGLVPLVVLVRAVLRQPGPRGVVLLAFVLVSVGIAVREALIYVFQDPIGTVHLGLQLMAPLWLATACGLLVQDFVRTLRQAAAERAAVDRRLAAREAELALLHAREREHATGEERLRIMQDMHDGLGSQLVSSLALAERGQLSPTQTAELLRACIEIGRAHV
jgi:signal transduction histidine kinase